MSTATPGGETLGETHCHPDRATIAIAGSQAEQHAATTILQRERVAHTRIVACERRQVSRNGCLRRTNKERPREPPRRPTLRRASRRRLKYRPALVSVPRARRASPHGPTKRATRRSRTGELLITKDFWDAA